MIRRALMATGLLLVVAHGVAAQEAAPADGLARVAAELNRLNLTLEAIRGLLTQQVETENLDLLFKRAEFAAARVTALESEVRRAEGEQRTLEDEKQSIESRLQMIADRLDSGSLEADRAELEEVTSHMVGALKRVQERLRDVELEIGELQGRLATKRRELREWQDLLDRRLSER